MGAIDDSPIVAGRVAEEDAAVIPQNPPPFILRSTGWLLIVLFVTVLTVSVIVDIPETVQCRYMLVPEDGADPIEAPLQAVVDRVEVKQGQQVNEGAPLFWLRSDEIRSWQTELRTLERDLAAKTESLGRLERSHDSELQILDNEIGRYQRELAFREDSKQERARMLEAFEELHEKKIVSEMVMAEHRLKMEEIRKDINLLEASREQVKLDRQRIINEHDRRRNEEQAELEKIQVRIDALQAQLNNSESAAGMVVRAPYDAVVIEVAQKNAGNVVQAGEQLCQLARLGSRQRARLFLGEKGLALLDRQQNVRLFFDAFPYQRYGSITGRLLWISEAAVATTEGRQFIATAALDQDTFTIGEKEHPLQVGMTGDARIVVGSRTLAENLIEPLRRLREETRH